MMQLFKQGEEYNIEIQSKNQGSGSLYTDGGAASALCLQ